MSPRSEFDYIFQSLKTLLQSYQPHLAVQADNHENYSLETISKSFRGKALFFGAVQIKKNYVSYYLMPVYVFPDLLEGLPESLRRRMQGKSCFNFKKLEDPALEDLRQLTRRGFERYQAEELL
jgi:hypothetical protein